MTKAVLAAGMIAALLTTSTASAVTITNRDAKEVKLTVVEGDARQAHVLSPGKVLDGVCQKGCIVRLNDTVDDEYELEGSETVSVEEGFLYFDSADGDGAPQDGSTKPKVEKRSK